MCAHVLAFDTSYLFTVSLPAVTASPCGNQASLMLLISDMSQTVSFTVERGGGATNGGGVVVNIWEERRDGVRWRRPIIYLN